MLFGPHPKLAEISGDSHQLWLRLPRHGIWYTTIENKVSILTVRLRHSITPWQHEEQGEVTKWLYQHKGQKAGGEKMMKPLVCMLKPPRNNTGECRKRKASGDSFATQSPPPLIMWACTLQVLINRSDLYYQAIKARGVIIRALRLHSGLPVCKEISRVTELVTFALFLSLSPKSRGSSIYPCIVPGSVPDHAHKKYLTF